MRRVAILGAGGMGTALALLLRPGRSSEVRLWSRDPGHAAEIAIGPGQRAASARDRIPERVRDHDPTAPRPPAGADLIVAAIPTSYLRATLEAMSGAIPPACRC